MFRGLRHRLEYLAVLVAVAVLERLPQPWVRALGRCLGRVGFHLGVARQVARRNLERYLGVGDPAERDRILKAAYAGLGQTMAELAALRSVSPEARKASFDIEGLDELKRLHALGKGVVCLSAHFGSWECMAAALAQHGMPLALVAGFQSNPWTDALLNRQREAAGAKVLRVKDVRGTLRFLKAGGLIAIMHDQDGDKWGTFVPFFGAPASTLSVADILARHSGAPMVYGVAVRGADGRGRLKVHVLPEAPAGLDQSRATAWRLARYNALLEADIRAHPEQWLWMHNRWQSVPWHRLSGEERARAERGEIRFDTELQAWVDAADGRVLTMETWR